ncbi:MAG: ABC transporter permease subunit [Planctomycetales bacterium]|nr:ABC transporter permease subunit [Planctomycetales bacterium]
MPGIVRWTQRLAPLLVGAAALGAWEWAVRHWSVQRYVIPGPVLIAQTIVERWDELAAAWVVTLKTMALALAAAAVGGAALAAAFTSSRWIEASLFPYAIILQVTPLVAVAPLLAMFLGGHFELVHFLCAWIVAFFPVLSNTAVGLRSADRAHRELFALYGASWWARLRLLLAPSALPYFLAGLRIAGSLSLVGAVVAEFVTGAVGDESGLASQILAGQMRLDTPMVFAALTLVSLTGIVVYFALGLLSWLLLRHWHDSAVR